MRATTYILVPLFLSHMLFYSSDSHSVSKATLINLNADYQAAMSSVVDLGIRLKTIEHELLYPDDAVVDIYLTSTSNSSYTPHSMSLSIDNSPVAMHTYSAHEIHALSQGLSHNVYTGTVAQGSHILSAIYTFKDSDGNLIDTTVEHRFIKTKVPTSIELLNYQKAGHRQSLSVKTW